MILLHLKKKGGGNGRYETAKSVNLVRFTIVLFVVLIAAILPTGLKIIQRQLAGPATFAHDGLIQTEIAIEYLLDDRNPYTEDYADTHMADFPGNEPPFTDAPLYHNAYLPFLFISSIPFYWLSQATLGWYDQRFVYLLAFLGSVLLLTQITDPKRPRDKLAIILAFGLNYLGIFYLADGRNDIMVFFFFAAATWLLSLNRVRGASLMIGLAMAIKHQAWFFLPFFILFLLPKQPQWKDGRKLVSQIWPVFLGVLLFVVPFLVWDMHSFIDDTVTYISGSGPNSFPMKGWGFSTFLLVTGLVSDPEAAFPFTLFALLAGLPVLFIMLRRQWRDNSLQNAWLGFLFFSFVFQFFSRFFSDNYVIFTLQMLLVIAFLKPVYATSASEEPLAHNIVG
ncbi:MAG: hypothetical protein BroJett015_16610 [Chloroflexota bacterium]|nr:MAG: hypothetical protein BroJett015_16610 [Chloroflexota bacterium]